MRISQLVVRTIMVVEYITPASTEMSNLKRDGKLRWAPSYLRNRGQMTQGQKRAMRTHWSKIGLSFQHDEILDLDQHYDFEGALLIEIGFGMADHLVHLAAALPDHRVLGIEVHRPGLAAACQKVAKMDLSNVRIMRGDARLVLTDHLASNIADAIIVQFPDPWPKEGDAHRRLIQSEFVDEIEQCLKPHGELLVVTDVDTYAEHTRSVFSEMSRWHAIERSLLHHHRIQTAYEKKAIAEGRTVTELSFRLR